MISLKFMTELINQRLKNMDLLIEKCNKSISHTLHLSGREVDTTFEMTFKQLQFYVITTKMQKEDIRS